MAKDEARRRDQRLSELHSQTVRGYIWSIGVGVCTAVLVIGLAYLRS